MEIINVFLVIISATLAYLFGRMKSFREAKQRAYSELLPGILKGVFDAKPIHEDEFNKSIHLLILYSNKRVFNKMENVLKIIHSKESKAREELIESLQEAIAEMRKDIQVLPWQKIDSREIKHLYTKTAN